jgi:isoquinoline 1-oxidoreductase alpha subunit
MITLKINGSDRQFDGDPDMPLLWYLRDELKLTGTKYGCGEGYCGACLIHIDGAAVRSCQSSMRFAEHKEIVTIEGLSPTASHPVQLAWKQAKVPQCGYCQSGQIMRAVVLLKQKPHPTDADIDQVMSAQICRCGTYQRIRDAIKAAAGAIPMEVKP